MIYALLGIPLTLLLLSVSVERVMGPVNGLLSIMNNRMGHLYSAFHIRWLVDQHAFKQNLLLSLNVQMVQTIIFLGFIGQGPSNRSVDNLLYKK